MAGLAAQAPGHWLRLTDWLRLTETLFRKARYGFDWNSSFDT